MAEWCNALLLTASCFIPLQVPIPATACGKASSDLGLGSVF